MSSTFSGVKPLSKKPTHGGGKKHVFHPFQIVMNPTNGCYWLPMTKTEQVRMALHAKSPYKSTFPW